MKAKGKERKKGQELIKGKACRNINVFSCFLKIPSEGAARISGSRLFQRRGATAEKARFLVFSFRASLGVRLLSLTSWLVRVTWVDLGGSRHSAKYRGPKPFRALYVSINTLKSMRNRMGSQCNAVRMGELC